MTNLNYVGASTSCQEHTVFTIENVFIVYSRFWAPTFYNSLKMILLFSISDVFYIQIFLKLVFWISIQLSLKCIDFNPNRYRFVAQPIIIARRCALVCFVLFPCM